MSAGLNHPEDHVRGVLWMLAAAASFSLVSGLVKGAGQTLHPFQIVFFRCLLGLLWLAPFIMRGGGRRALATTRPGIHAFRALAGISAMSVTFYAYAVLPLAQVMSLSFTSPLFMIPLAVFFLGEPVRLWRWGMTLVGFSGVLLMVRPGAVPFDPRLLAALASPFLIAVVQTTIKRMTGSESTLTIVSRFALASTLLSLPLALTVWRWPSGRELMLLFLIAGVATFAQSAMVKAYAWGEATRITPFDYSRLIFAGSIGFFFFGERPGLWTLAGALVIIASNLFMLKEKITPPPPRPPVAP